MKKLLIASSVLAALTMGAAHADPLTLNGGTIEFIGEITDTTCWAGVDGTTEKSSGTASTGNLVLLPTVPKSAFPNANSTAGRTKFAIAVRADLGTGDANECTLGTISDRDANNVPLPSSHKVNKVKAIFGTSLTATSEDIYGANGSSGGTPSTFHTGNLGNVDTATDYLNNLASAAAGLRTFDPTLSINPGMNGSAEGVQLRLLNADYSIINVGDAASQMTDSNTTPLDPADTNGTNTSSALATGTKALLPYYVEYIRTGAVEAGMVRSFVVYDLYYQ